MMNVKQLVLSVLFVASFAAGYKVGGSETDALRAEYSRRSAEAAGAAKMQEAGALLRYSEQANADAGTLQSLQEKLQEINAYLETIPNGAAECLSGADTDRLRGLW